MNPTMIQLHALIEGRVQGVGFRACTKRHARRLKIAGTVKNLPDGHVEIWAIGMKEQLEKLLYALQTDAGAARVHQIQATWMPMDRAFVDFCVEKSP